MRLFFALAVGLATTFVSAAPTSASDLEVDSEDVVNRPGNVTDLLPAVAVNNEPSEVYHSEHTVEMWLGTNKANVGDLTGSALYGMIWKSLNVICNVDRQHDCDSTRRYINVNYLTDKNKIAQGHTKLQVQSGYWRDDTVRRLLIGSVAGAFEAMSNLPENCYDVPGSKKFCNVGDRVKIHTTGGSMHVFLDGRTNDGLFWCCRSRARVDNVLDGLASEWLSVSPMWQDKGFSRDVKCIVGC